MGCLTCPESLQQQVPQKIKETRASVQTTHRHEFNLEISQPITGGWFWIADQLKEVHIMKDELPFNDRNQEVSWVLINRKNVAENRTVRYEVEASPVLPASSQQSPLSGSRGRSSELAVSLSARGRTYRPRFGCQRSDLDVEYTLTNLG